MANINYNHAPHSWYTSASMKMLAVLILMLPQGKRSWLNLHVVDCQPFQKEWLILFDLFGKEAGAEMASF